MNLALGGTADADRADAVDARQRVGDSFVENLVETGHRLRCLNRQNDHRNHVGAELEDNRSLGVVGKSRFDHVELVADVVGQNIDVFAVFKLESDDRSVLARFARDVLEVVDGVEDVFKRSGNILFDILSRGALIGRHDHEGVGLDVGIEVDR